MSIQFDARSNRTSLQFDTRSNRTSLLDDENILSQQLTDTILHDVWVAAINWLDAHGCHIDRRWGDVDSVGGADDFLYAEHTSSHEYEYISDTPPCNGDSYDEIVYLGPSTELQWVQNNQSFEPYFQSDIRVKYRCTHRDKNVGFFTNVDATIDDDGIINVTPLHPSAPILLKNVYEDMPKNIKFIIPSRHFNYIKLVDCRRDLFIDNCHCIHESSIISNHEK